MGTLRQPPFRAFLSDTRGAAALEYALIAAGIAAVIVAAVNLLGVSVKALYDTVATALGA